MSSPTNFLDRFEIVIASKIFNVSKASKKSKTRKCADYLCSQMLKCGKFLEYRPSQIAATSMLAAMVTVQQLQSQYGSNCKFNGDLQSIEVYNRILRNIPVKTQLKNWTQNI